MPHARTACIFWHPIHGDAPKKELLLELWEMSATWLAQLVRQGAASAREIAASFSGRIHTAEPPVAAFLHWDEKAVLQQAVAVDSRLAKNGPTGSLAGLPVGLKDNICVKGAPNTCASRILEGFVPPYDATVVQGLKDKGALIAGKLNMDEFAMGSSCETSYYKTTKNPWDRTRVPGGSSGGSAAAVAARMLPFALGSDTGGSLRQPAAFCGLVGLKPTYGAVSRYGLVAFASSLDQIGPLAQTADDAALLFFSICGADSRDGTSKACAYESADSTAPLPEAPTIKGLKIGIPAEYFGRGIQPEIRESVEKGIALLEKLGAQVDCFSLPSTTHALSAYYILSSAEASSNLARYDGIAYGFSAACNSSLSDFYEATRSQGFGNEVKRRIMLGTYVLSRGYYDAFYRRAKQMQRQIEREFQAAFCVYDMIATPTAPTTAFALGEKLQNPLDMYASDSCTVPASMAGLPAVSIPCGRDAQGLPIGMQLIGRPFSEKQLLTVAKCYELAVGGFCAPEVSL